MDYLAVIYLQTYFKEVNLNSIHSKVNIILEIKPLYSHQSYFLSIFILFLLPHQVDIIFILIYYEFE